MFGRGYKMQTSYKQIKFPLEDLNRFLQQQTNRTKMPNLTVKNYPKTHSKSLYYQTQFQFQEYGFKDPKLIKNTAVKKRSNCVTADQTLNAQILSNNRKKPATSQYRSNKYYVGSHNLSTKNNKIAMRTSSNNVRLQSVAGIPLNWEKMQERMQNSIHTKNQIRTNKLKAVQKQNIKMEKRVNNQKSQYSVKKLLKAYESHQKISKRLTESKISQRSHKSNYSKSVYSKCSSRSSIRSINSNISSANSTTRSNKQKTSNRFNKKLVNSKPIKISQHNINNISKTNNQQLNQFRSLFANSFGAAKGNNYGAAKCSSYGVKENYDNNYISGEKNTRRKQSFEGPADMLSDANSQRSFSSNVGKRTQQKQMNSLPISNLTSGKKITNNSFSHGKHMKKRQQNNFAQPHSDNLLHRIVEQMYPNNEQQNQKPKKKQQNYSKPQVNTNDKTTRRITSTHLGKQLKFS